MKAVTIAVVHPLLSTAQGDEGNARVLRHRAALRGSGFENAYEALAELTKA